MSPEKQKLRERLLQIHAASLSDQLRPNMTNMLERKYPPAQRLTLALCAFFCAAAAWRLAHYATHLPAGWPPVATPAALLGSAFLAVWGVMLAIAFLRGRLARSIEIGVGRLLTIATVSAIGLTTFIALGMSDRQSGTQLLLVATLFLMLVIPSFIQDMVEKAELRTREKLLELQLELQELRRDQKQDRDER